MDMVVLPPTQSSTGWVLHFLACSWDFNHLLVDSSKRCVVDGRCLALFAGIFFQCRNILDQVRDTGLGPVGSGAAFI
jgi:hypothetical protein